MTAHVLKGDDTNMKNKKEKWIGISVSSYLASQRGFCCCSSSASRFGVRSKMLAVVKSDYLSWCCLSVSLAILLRSLLLTRDAIHDLLLFRPFFEKPREIFCVIMLYLSTQTLPSGRNYHATLKSVKYTFFPIIMREMKPSDRQNHV